MSVECTQDSPATIDGATLKVLPTPRRIDLATLEQVRQEMARVYRDMRAGSIESQDGTRLVYVLAQLAKLHESTEVAKRLESLELALNRRKLK
ncbi:MAG: hypothetical protein K8F56_15825 [Rhodocyclaceae bacterium]|nr:hypothetical protein [Rhodocyclaceae bacterium]